MHTVTTPDQKPPREKRKRRRSQPPNMKLSPIPYKRLQSITSVEQAEEDLKTARLAAKRRPRPRDPSPARSVVNADVSDMRDAAADIIASAGDDQQIKEGAAPPVFPPASASFQQQQLPGQLVHQNALPQDAQQGFRYASGIDEEEYYPAPPAHPPVNQRLPQDDTQTTLDELSQLIASGEIEAQPDSLSTPAHTPLQRSSSEMSSDKAVDRDTATETAVIADGQGTEGGSTTTMTTTAITTQANTAENSEPEGIPQQRGRDRARSVPLERAKSLHRVTRLASMASRRSDSPSPPSRRPKARSRSASRSPALGHVTLHEEMTMNEDQAGSMPTSGKSSGSSHSDHVNTMVQRLESRIASTAASAASRSRSAVTISDIRGPFRGSAFTSRTHQSGSPITHNPRSTEGRRSISPAAGRNKSGGAPHSVSTISTLRRSARLQSSSGKRSTNPSSKSNSNVESTGRVPTSMNRQRFSSAAKLSPKMKTSPSPGLRSSRFPPSSAGRTVQGLSKSPSSLKQPNSRSGPRRKRKRTRYERSFSPSPSPHSRRALTISVPASRELSPATETRH